VEAATAAVHSAYVISMPQSQGRREVLDPVLRKHAARVTYVQPFDGRKQQAEPAVSSQASHSLQGCMGWRHAAGWACMHACSTCRT
jgi:hypothetical protein